MLKQMYFNFRFVKTLQQLPAKKEVCSNIRKFSSSNALLKQAGQKSLNEIEKDGYQIFYAFKYGTLAAIISRLKIYQGIITVGLLPIPFIQSKKEALTTEDKAKLFSTGAICVALTALLTMFSYRTGRMIVFMWLNRSTRKVKIAHITFWGRRTDVVIDSKIFPQLTKQDSKKILMEFTPKECSKAYTLTLHKTKLDKEMFNSVFGNDVLTEFLANRKK